LGKADKTLPAMAIRVRIITQSKFHTSVRKLSPEQVQELVAAYKDRATMRELAARYQIHRTTVSLHLRRQGPPVRRAKITC